MEQSTITAGLRQLRLNYLAENFDSFTDGCDKMGMQAKAIAERIVELELIEKARRGTEKRVKQSKLGRFKHIAEFDWNWPEKLDRKKIEKIFTCEFIGQKRNIILAGAQGLGKTMLAKNIGHEAALKGKSVLFTTASNLVMTLKAQTNQADLNRTLRKYVYPELLILDELGYLSYDCQAADLIFEIVNRRYENGSIIISTNLAFKDWNTIFSGAACLTAMIDRLTHHVEILKFEGKSFRLRESAQR
jgi:DNA replication protein DnaC